MEDIKTEEGWLDTPDGQQLYTKTWIPSDAPKARLVFLHGFSDHCNCYPTLFTSLASKGIKVYSFDQRGWGRSVKETKQRGLTGPTEQVMTDITAFVRNLPPANDNAPLFLMGHSMGGGETAMYASTGPHDVVSNIRGFLFESPLIGLVSKPWKTTVAMGRLASRVMPNMPLPQKLDASLMSRDPEVCEDWAKDELCHDTGTLEGLAGMLDRTAKIDEGSVIIPGNAGEGGKTRIWLGHGTGDRICDFEASKRWLERLKVEDKELKAYDGWYHKLHAEPGEDKMRFAEDVGKWILDRSGPLSDDVAKPKL